MMIRKREEGFIALTSVLIIGAVVLVLGVSLFHSALTDYSISSSYESGQQAAFLADFCLKEGILKLKENIDYEGAEDIEVDGKTCYIGLVESVDDNTNTKKVSSLGRAEDKAYFSRSSQLIRYVIESSASDWEKGESYNLEIDVDNNSLRLARSEDVESRTTDSFDEWEDYFYLTENMEITDGGYLVLVSEGPKKENGVPCENGDECQSPFCVDGVCCESDTCPVCQACNVVDHEGSCYNATTNWGAGTYGCTGSNKRCYGASCITCGGWMNAGYCWYSGNYNQSCTTVCSSHNGVYNGTCDWVNDPTNCSTCLHFQLGLSCSGSITYGPLAEPAYGAACYYHQDGNNNCDYSSALYIRQCACNH